MGVLGLAEQATLKLRGEKSYCVGIGEEPSGWREEPVQRDKVGLVRSRRVCTAVVEGVSRS